MNSALPPEWYLEIEGKKSGPFTAEQIEGFLHDREILARHRVFSPRRPEQKMSAGEFVSALDHQRVAQAKTRPFHAPDKPQGMDERTGIIRASSASAADPTQHLFDALQAVRERQNSQATKLATPTDAEWGSLSRAAPARKSQMVLVATLSILLAVSVWGLNRLLSHDAAVTASTAKSAGEGFVPPVESAKLDPKTNAHADTLNHASNGKGSASPASLGAGKTNGPTSLIRPHVGGIPAGQPIAVPAVLDRPRDRGTDAHVDEDRDTRDGAPKLIDRDPVADYERQQQGGDGSLQPLVAPQDPGIGGDPILNQGDQQPIDPNQNLVE